TIERMHIGNTMKDFFHQIFQYHHHYNQHMLQVFTDHIEKLPSRTFGLYCHTLNAHQIWNARILNRMAIGIMDLHTIEECRTLDLENLSTTMSILDTRQLDEPVTYKTRVGQEYTDSIQDVLFHAAN